MDKYVGKKLDGRYEIQEIIGIGGMATVYKANDIKDNKTVAIVAHRAPQLAFEVITMNKTWEEAIKDDWRNTKSWQPGWRYEIKG